MPEIIATPDPADSAADELRSLSMRDKRLLRVAADAAEQAYRRGVQQGAIAMWRHMEGGDDPAVLEQQIALWRFQRRPYRLSGGAPGLGPPEKNVTVIERFQREAAGKTFITLLHDPDYWAYTRFARGIDKST